MGRHRKPKSPDQIAAEKAMQRAQEREDAKRPEAWGVDTTVLSLPSKDDVETVADPHRKGRVQTAWRSNVFRTLYERKSINLSQRNAADYLMQQHAVRWGLDGKRKLEEPVDGAQGHPDLVTDRMMRAADECEAMLAGVGPASRELMRAFAQAIVREDRPMLWRGIVERVTGIKREDHQVGAVVLACEEVRRIVEGERKAA